MTEQITVPRATWDALQQALKDISEESYDKGAVECANHALTAANAVSEPQEAIAWEATTPGYIKYVTDKQYRSYSETAKRWYKPYKCSSCHPQSTEPAGYKLVPVELTREMLYAIQNDCDIMPQRGKRIWATLLAVAPTPPEAK